MNIIFRVVLLILCLVEPVLASPRFLAISDIHYGSDNASNPEADIGNEFLKITLEQIRQLNNQADFILFLGDLPTHTLFATAKKEENERAVFRGLYEADYGLKPMFYITGNNDSLAGNYQPFEVNGKSPLNFAPDWAGACVHCDGLIIDDSHMRSEGYYSSYVIPENKDIILIALNTTQLAHKSIFTPSYPNQEHDAQEQLAWLERQLAMNHARQLLIAMHIPPGYSYTGSLFWQKHYLKKFVALLKKYHVSYDQVTLLTSHTHMDEIRKVDLNDQKTIYAFSSPSIGRNHHNNSGMKIFTLNKQMAIKNFATYYTASLESWENGQYKALGAVDAIFPYCKSKTLAECLNSLSDVQVCSALEQDFFYGVKSSRVPKNACAKTYRIN